MRTSVDRHMSMACKQDQVIRAIEMNGNKASTFQIAWLLRYEKWPGKRPMSDQVRSLISLMKYETVIYKCGEIHHHHRRTRMVALWAVTEGYNEASMAKARAANKLKKEQNLKKAQEYRRKG